MSLLQTALLIIGHVLPMLGLVVYMLTCTMLVAMIKESFTGPYNKRESAIATVLSLALIVVLTVFVAWAWSNGNIYFKWLDNLQHKL